MWRDGVVQSDAPVGSRALPAPDFVPKMKQTPNFSTNPAYAFHGHYELPEEKAQQPFWRYVKAVASSEKKHFPTHFASVHEFKKYKCEAITKLQGSLGLDPFPERTPLNPRVVGIVDRGNYRIEKVIFESQPGFLVDALLYLPQVIKFPVPGILSPIGHYGDEGFFIWSEQGRCIGLAKKGFAVLTYDPISQGERKWLGNGDHDTLRRKLILGGMEASGLMFWDSIRAIDYLVSREEVDPDRIGVTGVSGGGFNALYTAVLDERVKAVAPAGFGTTLEALVNRGTAGCCAYLPNLNLYADMQNIYSLLAPRPLLILGGYNDFLSDRVLPIYESAKKVYELYDANQHFRYYLDPEAGHTYSKPMRMAMFQWFNRWLAGNENPAAAREPDDPEDALISRDSGLLKIFADGGRGRDADDLLKDHLRRRKIKYELPENPGAALTVQIQIKQRLLELLGDIPANEPLAIVKDDGIADPNSVRNVVLEVEGYLPIPITVHHPDDKKEGGTLIIYLSMEDHDPSSELSSQKMTEKLQAAGFVVAVPKVRGTGPTAVEDLNSISLYCMALGKHLFATRIYDLQRVMDFLLAQPQYHALRIVVWGEGAREGLMALYLAAIDTRVQVAVSSHGLVTYENVVEGDGVVDFDYYVPGVLRYADVPQIIAAICPRRVMISAPVDFNRNVISDERIEKAYTWAADVYRVLGHASDLAIVDPSDLISSLQGSREAGTVN